MKSNTKTIETPVTETPVVYNISQLMEQFKTKSAVIRHLADAGLARGAIVKVFTDGNVKMRYQHVRNVLVTPVKKA